MIEENDTAAHGVGSFARWRCTIDLAYYSRACPPGFPGLVAREWLGWSGGRQGRIPQPETLPLPASHPPLESAQYIEQALRQRCLDAFLGRHNVSPTCAQHTGAQTAAAGAAAVGPGGCSATGCRVSVHRQKLVRSFFVFTTFFLLLSVYCQNFSLSLLAPLGLRAIPATGSGVLSLQEHRSEDQLIQQMMKRELVQAVSTIFTRRAVQHSADNAIPKFSLQAHRLRESRLSPVAGLV